MARSYAKDTFFGTFHVFEGLEGKKQRDSLVDRFSFIQSMMSDELTNAEKREAQAWDDNYYRRATTTATVRDRFEEVVEAVHFTLDRETNSRFDQLRAAREVGDFVNPDFVFPKKTEPAQR